MDTLRKTRRRLMWMTGVLLLVGLALVWRHTRVQTYALVLRPGSDQAYLAAGRYGVILLQLPEEKENRTKGFVELSRFDTPGEAMDLAASGHRLYVADGEFGLRIIQVNSDIMQEVGALRPPPWAGKNPANTLALREEDYVLVGYGTAGVAVVNVSNPETPQEVARIPLDTGRVSDLVVQGSRLFIAAGEGGLLVYDITVPAKPVPLLQGNQFNSQKIVDVDMLGGNVAILAEVTGGVEVASVSPPNKPVSLGDAREIGVVRHVTIAFPPEQNSEKVWIFASVEDKGLQILEFIEGRVNPLTADAPLFPLPQGVRAVVFKPGSDFVYVVGKEGRLYALNIADKKHPQVAFDYVVTSFYPVGVGMWLGAIALFVVLLILWMGFFAQFVLPVRFLGERGKVWWYLFLYWTGRHGPAIFVENGQKRESRAESLRRGPAVMLLDTASAAVLKTPGSFTRSVGPGVAFLKRNERSAGEVDLHRQTQFIGPKGEGDVFAPQRPDENDDEYQARLEAREETVGQTRDGIPVVPNIIAVFKLHTEPEDVKRWPTHFGYRPESVWKAIVGEGINLDVRVEELPEKRRMAWNWLPAYLAVDVWREYVRQFTLEELFQERFPSLEDPDHLSTGMEVVVQQVAMRFRQPEVPALDGFGRYEYQADGSPLMVPSREFEIIRSRGLQVFTIVITNLRVPMEVEEQLLADWQSTWEFRVSNLGGAAERVRIREADRVRMNALVEYALWSSRSLYQRLQDDQRPRPEEQETLEIMLDDLRRHITEELNLRRRMTTEWEDWQDLLDWIRMD